jgi:hypothetical protein
MTELEQAQLEQWRATRSGAFAARGFHYQHLCVTLLLVRQWAGLSPVGVVVPEGLEDCVVELPAHESWIQIKSRERGAFAEGEVRNILQQVDAKVANRGVSKPARAFLMLERVTGVPTLSDVGGLFGVEDIMARVAVCDTPADDVRDLLVRQLGIAEVVAEGLVAELYKMVADASTRNASLPFRHRIRISSADVDRLIIDRLEATDTSAIDAAFVNRVLEPIDFRTSLADAGFYQGVKVEPGHIAAGLALERPIEVDRITRALMSGRNLLITGPSGAGKSALLWLTAKALVGQMRWFRVTTRASPQDAGAIASFVRARRPQDVSPICLAFDEIGSATSSLWDVLVRELRGLPHVHLVGSVRREDLSLLADHSDVVIVEATLNAGLAETLWAELRARGQTSFSHWREPFEQSEGLLLEYVHVLTRGKRLATLIRDQVRQRERDDRNDELAIIRTTAALCAYGGEVNANMLFRLLGLSDVDASRALRRLMDEHLVRESRPGVLGGLHALRSKALLDAAHDEIVHQREDSLWRAISAATYDTLPRVVGNVCIDPDYATDSTLRRIALALAGSNEPDFWAATMTGLGLGTLEQEVTAFIGVLERHEVERGNWFLASMFVDVSIDVPELSQAEQWQKLRAAILEYRALPKRDLRLTCMELLPKGTRIPAPRDLRQANHLLSSLVPVAGSPRVPPDLLPHISADATQNIRDIASILETIRLIDAQAAESLASDFGGELVLLSAFRAQTPWLSDPIIEPDGAHGRTVRANWHYVSQDHQTNPHETVCDICQTLIALSPRSEAAACEAVDPSGTPISIGGLRPWSKDIPRKSMPAKARVAWNVAFRQIFMARATLSLTSYAERIADLARQSEKLFRQFSERWIKGGRAVNVEQFVTEIDRVTLQVNQLTFAATSLPAASMTQPMDRDGEDQDAIGSLLVGVLSNLIPRIAKLPDQAKATATFAGSLSAQSSKHAASAIWRAAASPPQEELGALAVRLEALSGIAHEMARGANGLSVKEMLKAAKGSTVSKAVHAAARLCRRTAENRLLATLGKIEQAATQRDLKVACKCRPTADPEGYSWPGVEIAIFVEIDDVAQDGHRIADALSLAQEVLGDEWSFCIVATIAGRVVPALAYRPSKSLGLVPDSAFADKWAAYVDTPILKSEASVAFDGAMSACYVASTIINCRRLTSLAAEEASALSDTVDEFKRNYAILESASVSTGSADFAFACKHLLETWERVQQEFADAKAGEPPKDPVCMLVHRALSGQELDDSAPASGIAKILLQQAECRLQASLNASSP